MQVLSLPFPPSSPPSLPLPSPPPAPTVHHFNFRSVPSTRLHPKRQTLQSAFQSEMAFLKLSRGIVGLALCVVSSSGI